MKIVALLCFIVPKIVFSQCATNTDRWDAKILNDGTSLSSLPVLTSVAEQNGLPRPPKWQAQPRFQNERVLDSLFGTIVMAGKEGDNDFHLVLTDGGDSMIIEIPSPDDCSEITSHQNQYRSARNEAETLFGKITGTGIHPVNPKRVLVIGYGFFDKRGHGDGHAINGREIHPVLKLQLFE